MTIKFVCGCGKHLRARDSMAKMRVLCPGCGSLVGVPSLEPTLAGGAGPMTPMERLRRARANEVEPPDWLPHEGPAATKRDDHRVRLHVGKGPRRRSGRHLEKSWFECLAYPLRAWRLCLALALLLTALSVGFLVWAPRLINEPEPGEPSLTRWHLTGLLLGVLIAGLPCCFLDRVLASATAGEVDYIFWSGNVLTTFLLAGARWLACFLAGPAVLAAVAWTYWVRSGETAWVDVVILGEVATVALAYFLLALASVADRGRWRDLSPLAVADLAHRLRWRALAVVAAALILLALGLLLLAGVMEVHRGMARGWLMLAGVWFAAVFFGTFFARLLGVWCHRTQSEASRVA